MSVDATTVDLAPLAARFRVRPVARRGDVTWDRPVRFFARVLVAAAEVAALAAVGGPFDDRLVSWPVAAVVFAVLLWRSR